MAAARASAGRMPRTRGGHRGWRAVANASAPTRHGCAGTAMGRICGLLPVRQQGWRIGAGAGREFGAMTPAESTAAKFTQRSAHGILSTQGCSQTDAQWFVAGAPSLQRLLFLRAASHQDGRRRQVMRGLSAWGAQCFHPRGEAGPREQGSGPGFERKARNRGSRRRRHVVHALGINQQPILNRGAGNGGHNPLSARSHHAEWGPANPSRS